MSEQPKTGRCPLCGGGQTARASTPGFATCLNESCAMRGCEVPVDAWDALRERIHSAQEALLAVVGHSGPEHLSQTVDRAVALIRELRGHMAEGASTPTVATVVWEDNMVDAGPHHVVGVWIGHHETDSPSAQVPLMGVASEAETCPECGGEVVELKMRTPLNREPLPGDTTKYCGTCSAVLPSNGGSTASEIAARLRKKFAAIESKIKSGQPQVALESIQFGAEALCVEVEALGAAVPPVLEVELELPHQVLHHPDSGPPRSHREINVRAVGSDWTDPVKQYGPGGDFEWIRLPVRGVDAGEGGATAKCAHCEHDITGPSVCDGCFRANNDAAQAALDNLREQLRQERADVLAVAGQIDELARFPRVRLTTEIDVATLMTWSLALRAAVETEESETAGGSKQPEPEPPCATGPAQLLAAAKEALDSYADHGEHDADIQFRYALIQHMEQAWREHATLVRRVNLWRDVVRKLEHAALHSDTAQQFSDVWRRLNALERPDTSPYAIDAGPGLDVKVDDGGQAVPVCPVCKTLSMGAGGSHRCQCSTQAGRKPMTEDEWWAYVATHTGCRACHMPPTLVDGLLHHRCPATGKRWRKEPREWYARHGGAGEQATDEADPAACPVCDDCSRRAECTPSEDGPDCERWCSWQATDEAP